MGKINRIRIAVMLATSSALMQVPGCFSAEEAKTQLSNSIRDFFTAIFQTSLGNLLGNVF